MGLCLSGERPGKGKQQGASEGHYLQSTVGVGIVVGQVADVLAVLEGHTEGQSVVRATFLSPAWQRALRKVIPEKENK